MWTGGYTNQPSIDAPWLLKLVAALAILSIVGALIYVVVVSIGGPGSPSLSTEEAIYISLLHFVMPLLVMYTVTTNSPISRLLILGYIVTLSLSTIGGKGILGSFNMDPTLRAGILVLVVLAVALWLFASPKMRFYYAVISGRPIPGDLESRAASFVDESKLNPKIRVAFDWIADHLETIVLIGFSVLAVYAYVSTAS
jgi:hypothetical protein